MTWNNSLVREEEQDPLSYKMWEQQQTQPMAYQQAPRQNMSGDLVQNTTAGAAMGGPAGAAVMAGGTFLNSYLQAKAAEAQQRKQMLAQAAQTQGQGEQNALSNLMSAWGRSLT